MISDNKTNVLFLADSLPKFQRTFFNRFEKVLSKCGIPFELLPNTNDIWAVDYMPVQITDERFIQFKYKPDYLNEYKDTISDVDKICKAIKLNPEKSTLIVDGGNIVRTSDKVIMCDKVFHENRKIPEKALIKQLKDLFQVDKLIFIPWNTDDFTGHADGMVRFIDNDTVLINDYTKDKPEFHKSFRMSLYNAGLDWEELPYNPPIDPTYTSARGLYLNYLQMSQAIIMPTFKSPFDDKAYKILEDIFKGQNIKTVESREIAKEGGVLNCISWNIKQ